jgi:hypothetical protein
LFPYAPEFARGARLCQRKHFAPLRPTRSTGGGPTYACRRAGRAWCRRPPGSGSPIRRRDAPTGISSALVRCSWVIGRPASVTAAGTPPGHAAHATRRCTGRRSTPTAPCWMGLRPCASPTPRCSRRHPPAPPSAWVAGRSKTVRPPPAPLVAGPNRHFSSKTRSSIGWVIFTLLPLTSTMTSSPVVECPVDRMKNLSAA